MSDGVTFRPIAGQDVPFLERLYASTRQDELAQVDWPDEDKRVFLESQFAAQHRYYQEQFPDAQFHIILRDQVPIGRLYVHRRQDELRLIDIALVPEERGRGLGTTLMQDLMDEAREVGKPLRIHVEKFNPALRLYERLGFRALEDQGVYWLMEWTPEPG